MLIQTGMNTTPLVSLALLALLGASNPATLAAQDKGKIGDVQRSADSAQQRGRRGGGGDETESGGGWFGR